MKDFGSFLHDYRGAIIGRNNCHYSNMHRFFKTCNWNNSILCGSIHWKLCTKQQIRSKTKIIRFY